MTLLRARAPAKINLTLDVLGRRPDGYHEIRSTMQTLALADALTVARTPDAPGVSLVVTGPEAAGVPADSSNLVHRAAVRLQKIAAARGLLSPAASGLRITLDKQIPSQAGLGGGSSDAAATLKAVSILFDLRLSPRRLTALAAELGADVPFFLSGGTALVEGLGERVTPLPPLSPPWWMVLVKPPVGISTAAAYASLEPKMFALRNAFEPFALTHPAVAAVYETLRAAGGEPLLCGSGSAVFCRTADEAAAERMAERARAASIGKVWVTTTQEADE